MPTQREVLVSVASRLRNAYGYERSQLESKRLGRPISWRPMRPLDPQGKGSKVWVTLATFVHSRGYHPEDYIAAQFEQLAGRRIPEPGMLMQKFCEQKYEIFSKGKVEVCRQALTFQVETAKLQIRLREKLRGMSPANATHSVLIDTDLDLTALFRYCIAVTMPGRRFRELTQALQKGAAVQLLRAKDAYMEAWGELIPDELCQNARRWAK